VLKIAKAKTLPIGVDLGCSSLKMAQLQFSEGAYSLLAAGSTSLPHSCRSSLTKRLEFLSGSIREILKSGHFKGQQCLLSLPAEATFVQHVRIPRGPADQIAQALRVELEGKLACPVSDAIIRHIVAGKTHGNGEGKQEIIAVATAKATLEAYLQMAHRAKLDVVGVNVEPCAIVECFSRLFRRTSDAARTILFLDLGAASTQVVLAHGNKIAFARNLTTGIEQLDEVVAKGMKIPPEQADALRRDISNNNDDPEAQEKMYHLFDGWIEAITDELTQCLRYSESVFRNQTIERVIFVGGGAYDKRLCQSIAQRLNLPAQIGDPLLRIKSLDGASSGTGLDRRCPLPDWAVAVGLSIGATIAA